MSDSACGILADSTIKLLNDNLDALSPETVTKEMIDELVKLNADFKDAKGTSVRVRQIKPELTKQYDESFKPVKKRINHLKYLARDFKKNDPEFYGRVLATSEVPPVHTRHTSMVITVIDKNTGNPYEGAAFELVKAKKTAVTDYRGIAEWYIMKFGKDVLIGKIDGKVFYQEHIAIKRATVNEITVMVDVK